MTTTTPSSPTAGAQPDAPRAAPPATPPAPPRPRRRRAPVVLLGVFGLGIAAGTAWYLVHAGLESTDDAFVAADVYQINAKVPGRVAQVAVRENQHVEQGQLLAELETADYDARHAQAQAAVALADAQLREATIDVELVTASTGNAVTVAAADVAAAKAGFDRAQADLAAAAAEAARTDSDKQRYGQLSERAVSRQRLAAVEADATSAAATARAAGQRVASAQADVAAAEARLATAESERARVTAAAATVQRRQAELEAARASLRSAELDRSYTRVTAPAAGRVTRKAVLPGTYVQPGQALMAVVGDEVWVVANFKETQLLHMRAGQPATVHVDAYGIDLPAKVDSIQAGSGAAFSLLPPENATGNYVKVVQRVPVKLLFVRQPDAQLTLGPGMSVVPEVDVR